MLIMVVFVVYAEEWYIWYKRQAFFLFLVYTWHKCQAPFLFLFYTWHKCQAPFILKYGTKIGYFFYMVDFFLSYNDLRKVFFL